MGSELMADRDWRYWAKEAAAVAVWLAFWAFIVWALTTGDSGHIESSYWETGR